ncbi:MAG: DUF222 domain-containing protein [Pseudolysinimonas sp.]
MPTPTDLLARLNAAVDAVAAVPNGVDGYRALSDDRLSDAVRVLADLTRVAGSRAAIAAGEVARRSAPELGHDGLAQRSGHRTAIELMRAMTGATAREAATSVEAGLLVQQTVPDAATGEVYGDRPWLLPVGRAVVLGVISPAAAEAIRNGLGSPSVGVTEGDLTVAAEQLCDEALTLDADRLHRRSRELRDLLDEAGIADRERQRREQRGLKFWRRADGMGRLIWDLDPESTAVVGEIFDRVTSPKRGGPRFVDPEKQSEADVVRADERSPEQYASDAFVQLLRQGVGADSSRLLGGTPPAVRVLVCAEALNNHHGHGHIEGQHDPVSIQTVERIACGAGIVSLAFDDQGEGMNVGREQRLFTTRHRIGMAVRDGGCMWTDCDRPPSWTEAHHIDFWDRDHGETDVERGILLCKHHHLLAHDHGWEIRREQGTFWLIPPATIDPAQVPRELRSKSAAFRELIGQRSGAPRSRAGGVSAR